MASPLRRLPSLKYLGTKEAMIAVSASQLGYSEQSNNDTFFGRWYGMNNQPWCAIFISWAAFVSGNRKAIPKHAYTPSGAAWFKDRDRWHAKPRVGDIVYYDTSGLGRISHVGVVDQVFADGSWTSIEGNTNALGSREGRVVRRQKRRTVGTHRGGFGRPAYAPSPKPEVKAAASKVDLGNVVAKAKRDVYDGRVEAALRKEGLTPDREGYRKWQQRLGYEGRDADGIAGMPSLSKLGVKYGWKVQA